ncbi:ankyrin repeat domain-containing protein [Nonomuraea sp. NPDC049152]|uniref:ankyrin repeat domain-containing protein n=1 Tax=Nonomuraea sp. NPDC049152 TaxID=3154350 RepID=UPI0033C96EB5
MTENRLVSAAGTGAAAKVRRLLDGGAAPDQPDDGGTTALYRAAVQGNADIVRMLLAAGAEPDRESEGESEGLPLCAAASWGHLGTVVALLEGGADPDRTEGPGRQAMSALHWAAAKDFPAVVAALLDRNADPDLRDGAGGTALTHAARYGSAAVVSMLLDHGADPAVADEQERLPIDLAREFADRDIEAVVHDRALEYATEGARITVRREESEGGGERVVAEQRDSSGRLRSESVLGTGHAEIVRLLEARPARA